MDANVSRHTKLKNLNKFFIIVQIVKGIKSPYKVHAGNIAPTFVHNKNCFYEHGCYESLNPVRILIHPTQDEQNW